MPGLVCKKKKTKSSGPMEVDTLHMSLKDNVTVDVPESTEQPFFFAEGEQRRQHSTRRTLSRNMPSLRSVGHDLRVSTERRGGQKERMTRKGTAQFGTSWKQGQPISWNLMAAGKQSRKVAECRGSHAWANGKASGNGGDSRGRHRRQTAAMTSFALILRQAMAGIGIHM